MNFQCQYGRDDAREGGQESSILVGRISSRTSIICVWVVEKRKTNLVAYHLLQSFWADNSCQVHMHSTGWMNMYGLYVDIAHAHQASHHRRKGSCNIVSVGSSERTHSFFVVCTIANRHHD
jgi:hypothetical protein